jgi:hypothetical protein
MKKIIISLAVSSLLLIACESKSTGSANTSITEKDTLQTTKSQTDTSGLKGSGLGSLTANQLKEIVNRYIQLKNAFTTDDSHAAMQAGNLLKTAFTDFDKSSLTTGQISSFNDIAEGALEHAEHISKNEGNLKHQREHFKLLSQDIYDLVKEFGTTQVLYKDYCPMYDKGSYWLSEIKSIKNPYYGKAMSSCGTVEEELK